MLIFGFLHNTHDLHQLKKSVAPPPGKSGVEYALYCVASCIFVSLRARLVFDQPGAFCWFTGQKKKFFQKNQKRRLLAGSERICVRLVSGKGETHLIPPGKGVKRWM